MADKVKFYFGTKQAFDSLVNKDPTGLYFVDGLLYRGSELYTNKYKQVTEYPIYGDENTTYINTSDGSVKYWENNKYHILCKPILNKLDDSSTDDQLASAKAIYDAIIDNKGSIDKETIENMITNRVGYTDGASVTDYIKASLNNLIDGAPETLDTFRELASALTKDDSIIASLTTLISSKADTSSVRLASTPITEADLDYDLAQKINVANGSGDGSPLLAAKIDDTKSSYSKVYSSKKTEEKINSAITDINNSLMGEIKSTLQSSALIADNNAMLYEITELQGETSIIKTSLTPPVSPDNVATLISPQNFSVIASTEENNLLNFDNNGYFSNVEIAKNNKTATIRGSIPTASSLSSHSLGTIDLNGTYKFGVDLIHGAITSGNVVLNLYYLNNDSLFVNLASITLNNTTTQAIEFSSNVGPVYCKLDIRTTSSSIYDNYCIRPKLIKAINYNIDSCSKVYIPEKLNRLSETVYDYLKKDGFIWKNHTYVGQVLLNNASTFTLADATQTNTIGFDYTSSDIAQNGAYICSHFKTLTNIDDTEGIIGVSGLNGFRIYLNKSRLTTGQNVSGFLTWLTDKTLDVLYQKDTSHVTNYPSKIKLQTLGRNTATFSTTSYTTPKFTVQSIGIIENTYSLLDTNKFSEPNIVNNLTTTVEGSVLDGRQGKVLNDSITALSTNLNDILSNAKAELLNLESSKYETYTTSTSNVTLPAATDNGFIADWNLVPDSTKPQLTNMMINGDFSNGLSGWIRNAAVSSTFTLVNGEGVLTASQANASVYKKILGRMKSGDVIFMVARIKSSTYNTKVFLGSASMSTTGSSSYQIISKKVTLANDTTNTIEVYDYRTSGWDAIYIDYIQVFNMTMLGIDTYTEIQMKNLIDQNFSKYFNIQSVKNPIIKTSWVRDSRSYESLITTKGVDLYLLPNGKKDKLKSNGVKDVNANLHTIVDADITQFDVGTNFDVVYFSKPNDYEYYNDSTVTTASAQALLMPGFEADTYGAITEKYKIANMDNTHFIITIPHGLYTTLTEVRNIFRNYAYLYETKYIGAANFNTNLNMHGVLRSYPNACFYVNTDLISIGTFEGQIPINKSAQLDTNTETIISLKTQLESLNTKTEVINTTLQNDVSTINTNLALQHGGLIMQNGWGINWDYFKFTKTANRAHLQAIFTTGILVEGTIILNIPADLRPVSKHVPLCMQASTGGCGFASLTTSGDISISGPVVSLNAPWYAINETWEII